MMGKEAAEAADHYFDKNGRFMHPTQTTAVNQVTSRSQNESCNSEAPAQNNFTTAFSDGDNAGDVNAIRQPFRGRSQSRGNRGPSQVRFSNSSNNGSNNNGGAKQSQGFSQTQTGRRFICSFHLQFRDRAKKCQPGCEWVNRNPGNGNPGRRM